jgi:hypothetical protein
VEAVFWVAGLSAFAAFVVLVNRSRAKGFRERWQLAADLLDLEFEPAGSELGRVHGTLGGFAVEVDAHGLKTRRGHDPYTRYRVFYSDLGLGLWLRRQKGWTKAIASMVGQDLDVGDAVFDKAFLVDGNDEDAVRAFLTSGRRTTLLYLLVDYPDLTMRDDSLTWLSKGTDESGEAMAAHLQRLTEGVRQLLR